MRRAATIVMAGLAAWSAGPGPASGDEPLELRLLGSLAVFDRDEGLEEPSGLALDPATGTLWTVSDDTERAFSLGAGGAVDRQRSVRVKETDLEGITALPAGTLAAVREKGNEILIVAAEDGRILGRHALAEMAGYDALRDDFEDGPDGKGLEGITVDPATGSVYVVKEGVPRLLLEVSPDLDAITAVHRLTRATGVRADGVSDEELDVSGIAYDPRRRRFWIVSDTGRRVFLYDPAARRAESAALVVQKDGALKPVKNAEGVALNADGTILFVITDDGDDSVLVAYEILDPRD